MEVLSWVLLLLSVRGSLQLSTSVEDSDQSPFQLCASQGANCTCGYQLFHNLSRHNSLRVLTCANYQQLNHFSSVISVVDLRHNSVPYLDQVLRLIIYREILLLNVASNDIFELHSTQFNRQYNASWMSLQYIDLSANQIRSIDPVYFAIFPSLTHLMLDGNRISQLPEGVFSGLAKLRQLSLTGNPMKSLDADPFKPGYPAQLTSLNLSRCRLEDADPVFFASIFFLNSLDLSQNRLSYLPASGYPSLAALSSLILSGNRFQSVPTRFLRHFRRLDELLLDGNRGIRRLGENDLAGINVSRVSMRGCDLGVVDAMAVHNVSYLMELDFSSNRQLSFLHHRAFQGVYRLSRLNLDSCHLHSMPGEFANQVLSTVVSIRYNPLWCICDNAWISDNLLPRPAKVTFEHPESLYCTAYSVVTPSRGEPFTVIERRHMINASVSESAGCPPRIYHPLSNLTVELSQGDSVILECLSSGLPRPSVFWMFPDEQTHLEATPGPQPDAGDPEPSRRPHRSRVQLHNGLLEMRDARVSDSGKYTCTAFNSHGKAGLTYIVIVQSRLLQLVPLSASTDRLSVTWRGTDRYHAEYYHIGYREVNSYELSPRRSQAFRSVYHIRHEWRSFTAHHLKPSRYYQFCLIHRHARHLYDNGSSQLELHEVEFPLVLNTGQCITMRTKHSIQHLYGHGIYRVAHHSTVYIMLGMVFGILFLCCMTALVYRRSCKKLRQTRKQYRYSTVSFRDGNTLQMKVLFDGPPSPGNAEQQEQQQQQQQQYNSRTNLLHLSEQEASVAW